MRVVVAVAPVFFLLFLIATCAQGRIFHPPEDDVEEKGLIGETLDDVLERLDFQFFGFDGEIIAQLRDRFGGETLQTILSNIDINKTIQSLLAIIEDGKFGDGDIQVILSLLLSLLEESETGDVEDRDVGETLQTILGNIDINETIQAFLAIIEDGEFGDGDVPVIFFLLLSLLEESETGDVGEREVDVTLSPTIPPTSTPTISPTAMPTSSPTSMPSVSPTSTPTISPTSMPTNSPTSMPSASPTSMPSTSPTSMPSTSPTFMPSTSPTSMPSDMPSDAPSDAPSDMPSDMPTTMPSELFSEREIPQPLPAFEEFFNCDERLVCSDGGPWGNQQGYEMSAMDDDGTCQTYCFWTGAVWFRKIQGWSCAKENFSCDNLERFSFVGLALDVAIDILQRLGVAEDDIPTS